PGSGHGSGVITTSNKFENFIENDDEWFSDIELKVLDLEQELTEWRESRTREFTETPPRRDREMLRTGGNARQTRPGPASKPRKPSGRAQVLIERGRHPARRARSGRGRKIGIGTAAGLVVLIVGAMM